MKKFPKILAGVLAAGMAVTLAGCTSCSSKVSNNALTNSNWYTQTGYKGIQSYFVDTDTEHFQPEVITYDVTHTEKSNGYFSVEYTDGTFTTRFYATTYDWNDENIPDETLREDKTETVYCYETELNIRVRYTKSDESTDWFEDRVKTVSVFRSAQYNLQPVYSRQEIKSTSPAKQNPSTLDDAYTQYDVVYDNFYNYSCTSVTSYKTEGDNQPEVKNYGSLNKTSHTLFDNSALYIAVRSMKLSDSLSQSIDLFTAASGGIATMNLSGSNTALGKEEHKAISEALADKGLYTPVTVDGEGNEIEDAGVPTVAVSVAYNGGNMSGTAQTVWYAAITDADYNTARCTMLKLAVPLPFSLGTLTYTLKEVTSTIWNG